MWRFGLRARTAASNVLVTAAAVLIVEAVLLGFVISSAGGSSLTARLQNQAGNDAKVLSATVTKMSMSLPPAVDEDRLAMAMKTSMDDTGFGGRRGRRASPSRSSRAGPGMRRSRRCSTSRGSSSPARPATAIRRARGS
ncbi:hypothetical protein Sme01_38200 [Sphaerisporangium melleum]|uniref:Uncharacterized protein n=1 Tax=Sphaerisporangium melleum TaxID=321316 RepID=A0A917R0Z3_9ACTN|nr:hypothetical protein [Sphaerisporangium melleum]GGK82377.1 hypothetical protein GCM10007964_26290 [Sphaerisporangium melleum]GII71344.1 hypothetical protein Sme01_38200 [Sphaerisporangium melleum]